MIGDFISADDALIIALKGGSEKAFTSIYKKYWYQMYHVAYRKLQSKEVAEELIQEIFMRLWTDREKVRIVNLKYYLFSAVRYEVIDTIRLNSSRNEYLSYYQSFSSKTDCNTQETVEYNDLAKSIDEGLDTLSPKSREIFQLYRIENWSVSKIAKYFNITDKAVEYHITKATKLLRSYLNETIISVFLILLF